jgi:hypothetical protein
MIQSWIVVFSTLVRVCGDCGMGRPHLPVVSSALVLESLIHMRLVAGIPGTTCFLLPIMKLQFTVVVAVTVGFVTRFI